MVWFLGLTVFVVVHALGAFAGLLYVNGEAKKAGAISAVALVAALLAIYFAQVVADLKSVTSRQEELDRQNGR